MPWQLQRFQQCRHLHFVTFSCYRRQARLATPADRVAFEQTLERMSRKYRFFICGYVVMPEHVHMLVSEPEQATLATALQVIKQSVSRRLRADDEPFWYERYYDFNVFCERKRIEKLRYIHRNPVTRGLVQRPEEWAWSSFNHYRTGLEGIVEIESMWTALRRERAGEVLTIEAKRTAESTTPPYPKEG